MLGWGPPVLGGVTLEMMLKPPTSNATWRRADCLGACGIVKRARDAWIELGGTRSGSWLIAIGVDAGRTLADTFPPSGEELFILGVAHSTCLEQACRLLRAQKMLWGSHMGLWV
jgi:hypothetical protein